MDSWVSHLLLDLVCDNTRLSLLAFICLALEIVYLLRLRLTGQIVSVYVSGLIGALTSTSSFFASRYKHLLEIDEGLDIFAIHGVGGYVGDVLTGFFAASFVPALDGRSGSTYKGGWWNRNYRQMGLQLAAATVCAAWSFVISCILLFIIDKIPGCKIRVSEEEELAGLDVTYLLDADMEMLAVLGLGVGESGGSAESSLRRNTAGDNKDVMGEKTVGSGTKSD